MENLKIRVNSADESKEIQNILESKGFKKWEGWSELGSIGGFIWTDSDMTYCDNRIGYFDGSPRKEITLPELRAMVDQDQDEPFLTPEFTLNDQCAEKDNVNHPNHYNQGKVECIDALESATIGKSGIEAVCVANVIKYLWRYEEKNGLEDVKKAQFYLNRLLATLENNNG